MKMLVNKELCLSFFLLPACLHADQVHAKITGVGLLMSQEGSVTEILLSCCKNNRCCRCSQKPWKFQFLLELTDCWHLSTVWASNVYDHPLEGWNKCLIWSMFIYQYLLPFTHIWPIKGPSQMLQSDFAALVALLWPDFTSTADLTQSTHSSCGEREKRLEATEACILFTPCYTSAFRNFCFCYLRFSSASCDVK